MNSNLPSIRVGLVEDRDADRELLVNLLRDSAGFDCVAACCSAKQALRVLPGCQAEIVLMDIGLSGASGIDLLRELKPLLPKTQFMMLTVFEDHNRIFRSLYAGANGYVLKKTPPSKLLEAIQELHEGGAPMSGQVAREVVAAFRERAPWTPPEARLSPAEQNVLERLARGLLYKEIADQSHMAVSTVRTHIWHIYTKLHVRNRTEAILKGLPHPRR